MAGLQIGVHDALDEDRPAVERRARFAPLRPAVGLDELYDGWLAAVRRVRAGR